jgi:hypothetical protein
MKNKEINKYIYEKLFISSSGAVEHNKRQIPKIYCFKNLTRLFSCRQTEIYCKTYVFQIDKYFKSQHCLKDSKAFTKRMKRTESIILRIITIRTITQKSRGECLVEIDQVKTKKNLEN